jgi:hypothetical protein
MSEETQNDGTLSGLKKTMIGVIGTVVTAGGVYLTTLFGSGDIEKQPAQPTPVPVININNNQQQTAAPTSKTVIIKEVSKPTTTQTTVVKPKKKEGDEFKEEAPKW